MILDVLRVSAASPQGMCSHAWQFEAKFHRLLLTTRLTLTLFQEVTRLTSKWWWIQEQAFKLTNKNYDSLYIPWATSTQVWSIWTIWIHSGMPISPAEWLPTLLLCLQHECQFTVFVHDHRLPGHVSYLSVSAIAHYNTVYSRFYWLLGL